MNLPTKITVLRLVLIPVFVALYLIDFKYHMLAATIVFVIASATDWLDGYLARKLNLVTDLGKFLDPIADKVLVCSALVLIVTIVTANPIFQLLIIIATLIILARELIITCFRTIAVQKNVVIAADKIGKVKTTTQLIGLSFYLPYRDFMEMGKVAGNIFFYVGFVFLMIATVLTVVSAVNYIVKNRAVLKQDDAKQA